MNKDFKEVLEHMKDNEPTGKDVEMFLKHKYNPNAEESKAKQLRFEEVDSYTFHCLREDNMIEHDVLYMIKGYYPLEFD